VSDVKHESKSVQTSGEFAEQVSSAETAGEKAAGSQRNPSVEPTLSGVLGEAARRPLSRLGQLFAAFESLLTRQYLSVYGIAATRILLGITGIGILATNFTARHYVFTTGYAWSGELADPKSDFPTIWLFSLFHSLTTSPALYTLAYLALGVLAVLITLGWRTRLVLPVYLVFWISFIETNDGAGDQGDNAYRMFLIAMLLTNSTLRWSLDARRRRKRGVDRRQQFRSYRWALVAAHNLALAVLAFHVCAIYVAGGLFKAGGVAWQQGFAIYNPLQTKPFGTWPVLSDLVTAWGPGVAIVTWGSLLFQIAFPFLLFSRYTKIVALVGILGFHIGIGVLMGLPWFSLTMIAVDAIFIRSRSFKRVARSIRSFSRKLYSVNDRWPESSLR